MYNLIYIFLKEIGLTDGLETVSYIVSLVITALICFLVNSILKFIVEKAAKKITEKTKSKWDNIFFKNKIFKRCVNILIPVTFSIYSGGFSQGSPQYFYDVANIITGISTVWVFVMIFDSIINSADEIYKLYEISKIRPIKAFLQILKVIVFIISGVTGTAVIVGESPLVLLGGIGAMTAVTSLIFKDAILGFVAGIQLTGNDMIRIGDWIECPKYSANGDVIDLTMTTVKVQNFDKTITSIPAYALVSDSFINWRGMENAGGRRIKRSVYINVADVRLCNDEMIERFKKINFIKEYMNVKLAEIEEHNNMYSYNMEDSVNGRRITNIGTFRAYITEYLKRHKGIHKDMTVMVRQLEAEGEGVPLEIYTFTDTVNWEQYENIQSDIFDHLYAVAPEFGLRIYQKPSGSDIRNFGKYSDINH